MYSALLVALLSQALVVFGQEGGDAALTLHFRRDFGYALGKQMQGKFTIRADGPQDLTRVEFLLDGQVIAEDSKAPFSLAFDTGQYPEGIHHFSALGYRSNGDRLQSDVISQQFVAGNRVTVVVVVIVGLVLLFGLASFLLARRSKSTKAGYGYLGGAVCSNCGRPFSIHWWSLRLGIGRFDRCPHCGKWHMTHRASAEALQAAEDAFGEGQGQAAAESENQEEKLRRLLDESRYDQG